MPKLVYHGWSCFTLTTVRGLKLVFDPNWTNPFGQPSTGPSAFTDADLCLATHGHFDHIQDVPGLNEGLTHRASRLVRGLSLPSRNSRDRGGLDARLEMDQALDWSGLAVTTFE